MGDGNLAVVAATERVGEIAAANGLVLHELTAAGDARGGLPRAHVGVGRVKELVAAEYSKFRRPGRGSGSCSSSSL